MDRIEEQKEILEFFGVNTQKKKLEEELSELKTVFFLDRHDRIVSKLADVYNLILQLIGHYGAKEIFDYSNGKTMRTKRRIKSGYYKKV